MNGRVYPDYADYEDDVAKVLDEINKPFIDKIEAEVLSTPGASFALKRYIRNGIRSKAKIIFKEKKEDDNDG